MSFSDSGCSSIEAAAAAASSSSYGVQGLGEAKKIKGEGVVGELVVQLEDTQQGGGGEIRWVSPRRTRCEIGFIWRKQSLRVRFMPSPPVWKEG